MAIVPKGIDVEHSAAREADGPPIPPLENGDRLTRAEFERRYDAMPGLKRAELIEGVVSLPSPRVTFTHGQATAALNGWLGLYSTEIPGVTAAAHAHIRLDPENMPQPDGLLLIEPERGGQARISADDYVEGAPELVLEVAASTASIDRHAKFRVYRRNGVREYLLWRVLDRAVEWFILRDGEYVPLAPDADGLLKSEVFPGLWLDAGALLRGDLAAVLEAVRRGAATPEHAAFVARLRG